MPSYNSATNSENDNLINQNQPSWKREVGEKKEKKKKILKLSCNASGWNYKNVQSL